MEEKEVLFKGKVVRKVYDGGDYKVYAVEVNRDLYPDIKFTKYGAASIYGDVHELGIGIDYEIKAIEENNKYGYGYKIKNITRRKPSSAQDMYVFLEEILTVNQAQTLYEVYPDIVDRVMNNRLEDVDLNKLKGIKEYTFNVIKEKIAENFCLAELVNEFHGLISLSVLKKLYDKYASVLMIKKKLREDPYKCLCGLARIGFVTADAILLELEKAMENGNKVINFDHELKTSKERCLSCMLYLLEKNEEEGHTNMTIESLRNQCLKLVPACASYFVECIKHESIYYDKDKMIVSLRITYETEEYIAKKIIAALLDTSDKWVFDKNEYRNVDGFELTDEQLKVIDNVCWHKVSILNGPAGTGKSSSTKALIKLLKNNDISFRLFAPTGKASKVLHEFTNEPASTIHRGLGYMPPSNWTYNKDMPLDCQVLIIDEISMCDVFLFKHILDAVDFNVTRLLLIGDNSQLPSVSCGNLLHDFMESNVIPTVTLTKVFRYSDGGLMKVATDVRCCKPYLSNDIDGYKVFGDNKDYMFINCAGDVMVKNAVALYAKLLNNGFKPSDIQVLSAYKKGDCGIHAINNAIQKIANRENYNTPYYMKVGDVFYYEGDIVIQNVNNYKAEIYHEPFEKINEDEPVQAFVANGETGVIEEINNNEAIINFDGTKVRYYRNDMQMISLGYAITIHKSQGSSIRIVILLTPQSHTFMLNSNLIYVGLTRMKEKCYHFGNVKTINMAIKKKENFARNTFMQSLFKEYGKELKKQN